MAMKWYSAFPKAPALLEPHHQILCYIQDTHCGWVGVSLPLCRGAVGVFYSPDQLGKFNNDDYLEQEGDSDINHSLSTWNGPQRLGKKSGGIWNPRKNQHYTDHSIVQIGENTLESWEDLLSLKIKWKNYQLTLAWKTHLCLYILSNIMNY